MAVDVGTLQATLTLRDQMTPALSGAMKSLTGAVAGMVSFAAAIKVADTALTAYAESEASVNKLNRALVNQGIYSDKLTTSLQRQADALMKISTFDDEAIRGAQALFATFGMAPAEIERATKAAVDFAARTGMSVEEAARAINMGTMGMGRAFKAYGIEVKDTGDRHQNLINLLGQLEAKMGGAALEQTKTYTGAMKQLKVQIGETWESVGKLLNQLANAGGTVGMSMTFWDRLQKFFGHDLVMALGFARGGISIMFATILEGAAKVGDAINKITFGKAGIDTTAMRLAAKDQRDFAMATMVAAEQAAHASVTLSSMSEAERKAAAAAAAAATATAAATKARDADTKAAEARQKALEEAARQMAKYFHDMASVALPNSTTLMRQFGKEVSASAAEMEILSIDASGLAKATEAVLAKASFGKTLMANLKDALKNLPNVILGAIQGGGDVGKAIGATLGTAIGTSMADSFAPILAKKLGDTLGGALGSILPGLGAMLGQGLGSLLGKGLGALGIGGNREIMKVNDLRDAFFQAQGGFEAFARTVRNATNQDLIKRIFDARTVEEFNAAVAQTMNFLDLQKEAQQKLDEAVERYGFTIEELGPKFAQQKLDEQAAQLLQDWQLLAAAGVDMNALIARMGPAFNEYVQQVIAAGGTLPEQMRPIIEKMIQEGQLLDENGQAYTNLEETGLRFTESLTESMQRLIDRIGDLVNALLGIPNIDRTVTVNTNYASSGGSNNPSESNYDPLMGPRPPGYTGPWPPMARGGVVHGNVLPFVPHAGAGAYVPATPGGQPFIAGEGGGDEVIAPVRALFGSLGDSIASKVAAASRGSGMQHVHLHLNGREIASWLLDGTRTGHVLQDAAGSRARG